MEAATPAPPKGCEWVLAEEIRLEDLLPATHPMRGREWFRVIEINPKPKSIWFKAVPISEDLAGMELDQRPRKGTYLAVQRDKT